MRIILGVILFALFLSGPAQSQDGWEGRPLVCNPVDIPSAERLARCQKWVQDAMQPDHRTVSCCADADTYVADRIEEIDGQMYAVIADGYEGFPHGSKVLIPANKQNNAALDGGNPTGKIVVFMPQGSTAESYYIYCFFGGTGA